MTFPALLGRFLFTHSARAGGVRQQVPVADAPLYAYCCTENFYQTLLDALRQHVGQAVRGRVPDGFAACFCLYAAETFRRDHVEGPWAWRTVFDPLGVAVPQNPTIGHWVDVGLQYWQRPVLIGTAGQRMRLVTIACEGGLPLQLLNQQGANLRVFFTRLLQSYHARPCDAAGLQQLAREQVRVLPALLRNEEVVRLAARLVGRTVELQALVGDAPGNPLETLDTVQPGWRSTLPLRLDDAVAETLFRNLISESRTLSSAQGARPGWLGALRRLADGRLVVEQVLRFPALLDPASLDQLAGAPVSHSPRLRVSLQSGAQQQPIAVLTQQVPRAGADPVYRREWLSREAVVRRDAAVLAPMQLQLHAGDRRYPLAVDDAEPWGCSPWTFLPGAEVDHWRWLGEGSLRTRRSEAVVVAPAAYRPQGCPDAAVCERLAPLPAIDRIAWRISGTVTFHTPDGECYRITTSADSDSADRPQLLGITVGQLLNQGVVFQGCPRFHVNHLAAPGQSPLRTEWRPVGGGGGWRGDLNGCAGRVWVRLFDPNTAVEQLRRLIDVLPSDSEIDRTIGDQGQQGRVRLTSTRLRSVRLCDADASVSVHADAGGGGFTVVCRPVPDTSLAPLRLLLQCDVGEPVELVYPRPQRGAALLLDGRRCDHDETVTLDRLHGLWLLVQNPAGAERFALGTELLEPGAYQGQTVDRVALPPLQRGELTLNLGMLLHDAVSQLLATQLSADATVRISVASLHGNTLACVRIARYDLVIEPVPGRAAVQLRADELHKLGERWTSAVTLQMLPLWAPSEPPIPLPLVDAPIPQWTLPEGLAPGPWWVVGADGDWKRFRPLLWPMPAATAADAPERRPGLAGAVCEADPMCRADRLDTALAALAAAPDHPDWAVLLGYVRLAINIAPTSLDPLQRLIHHPDALALSLLMADDAGFDRLISLADQMPFAWWLVPVRGWRGAAVGYFTHLRTTLSAIDGSEDLCWGVFAAFRARALAARPWFKPVCDWLQMAVFADRPVENNELIALQALPDAVVRQLFEQEVAALQARHDADAIWPLSDAVLRLADGGLIDADYRWPALTPYHRPTRCAPFVAAALALRGANAAVPEPALIHALKRVRDFDSEWFDQAYALALALGLARGEHGD